MAEIIAGSGRVIDESAGRRVQALRSFRLRDASFHGLTLSATLAVLILLAGVIVALAIGALPAIKAFGFGFLVTDIWNPATNRFGAAAAIYGTLVTSAIAMLLAVPVGLGIGIFLTELCPPRWRRPIGIAIELLAGIPSIIYGIWGLFVLAPFLQQVVEPRLIAFFGPVPGLSALFSGPPFGVGIFTAGIILGIMVLPYIASISRDVFATVPPVLREAAYGIGSTTSEVVRNIIIPHARAGIVGGIMLALGRALGETMAVTFVIGNTHRISSSLLAPGTTISAAIANEFTEAITDLYTASLIELGLVLFVITFIVLAAARFMLIRLERKVAM